MDLNFFRRAEQRFASRTAAPLDYGLLVAMLQTRQAASAAARGHGAARMLQSGLRVSRALPEKVGTGFSAGKRSSK